MKRWEFWIDVGGTFTDCLARDPKGNEYQHKTLSSGVTKGSVGEGSARGQIVDARREDDPAGIWSGYEIRFSEGRALCRVTHFHGGILHVDGSSPPSGSYELIGPEPAPLVGIRYILGYALDQPLPPMDVRLGTTRGTNALLTRAGSRTALITTKGFRDALRIGYQARPDLFALEIHKPEELYETILEIDERMDCNGAVLAECSPGTIRRELATLRDQGIESLAVVLLHSCVNPSHESLVGAIARELGFANTSLSHEVSSLRKFVPRGDTTVVDAYLNLILCQYIDELRASLHPGSTLQLMTSSGGLTPAERFRGKDSILSGPAGGVVGVARASQQAGFATAVGFDMGGTSTDVSRWAGQFNLEYETEKAGVRVVTPMTSVETVAAGGGSLCRFDGVKLTVGPESAGADPGPACYGAGGPLAVTDVNFFLGKIPESEFPFELDRQEVERLLLQQCQRIQKATGKRYSPTELAAGYLRVANTNMTEAIRCISIDRGIDPRNDVMVAFGGAAGQHACAVANELSISKVLLHPCGGVLSAFGIGLAEITVHREAGVYQLLNAMTMDEIERIYADLQRAAATELDGRNDQLCFSRFLDLRFQGLDQPIQIAFRADGAYQAAYETAFQSQCGYLPPERQVEVVTARVVAARIDRQEQVRSMRKRAQTTPMPNGKRFVYFGEELRETRVYAREGLRPGDVIAGPAIVTEPVSTIVIDPGWVGEVMTERELLLQRTKQNPNVDRVEAGSADPVLLEVFNKRFVAVATQMGTTLRTHARSVNVKERLDYSCAIFTSAGELVVNAPHIPVHLGAMGTTVQYVLQRLSLEPDDVVVTNDPYHGGSHLPDITVVTPVHDARGNLMFLTASRAHHAEVGGVAPGSMPACSTNLAEEGVLIRAMKVIAAGESRLSELQSLLQSSRYPSRDCATNLADITAQIAANRQGADNLLRFVDEYSWHVVSRYMRFIQNAAEQKARMALEARATGTREFVDHLDDGSRIAVALSIEDGSAKLDFSKTDRQLEGNLNANRAIVTAATLYCLRLLIDEDIPLNAGVLRPVEIVLPPCLLNPQADPDPQKCPAVVGGNVETSQRVVDVILGALGVAAASQGTMNNLLFGNETFGYYETICGGAGATANRDGADAVHTHMTNTRLTDPEVLESRFPVRLRRFGIRDGSGGRGQQRGGNGVIREMEFLAPLQVSLLTQRRGPFRPYGVAGGGHGELGLNELIQNDGTVEVLPAIASVQVRAGDAIRISTPGGGAWGKE